MKRLVVFLGICLLGAGGSLTATEPAWWSAPATSIKEPGATPDNGAPATVGQLKNVAKKAALYLNTSLPAPGAGTTVNNLVAGFQRAPDDLAPITLGQLKAVAKPFYDRLLSIGYNTNQNLIAHGVSGWTLNYPWDPATPKADNLALANLGQMKLVFSFDLANFDSDGHGLPDEWEIFYFGSTGHYASADDDGDGLSNGSEYTNGGIPNKKDNLLVKLQVSVQLK